MNSEPLNSGEIAAVLRNSPTAARAYEMIGAIVARREYIRAREREITPSTNPEYYAHPAAFVEASLASESAVKALRDERAAISAEIDHLHTLERLAFDAQAAAAKAEVLAGGPRALKGLPKSIGAVRDALTALDVAIERANGTLNAIGSYVAEGGSFPWDDGQLAELLAVREQLWATRTLSIPTIADVDDRARFPKSWPLLFAAHGGSPEIGIAYHLRMPPQPATFAPNDERVGDWSMATGDAPRRSAA